MSAFSENRYTKYRSVVLKNNTLGTIDIIFINKFNFLFHFQFLALQNLVKCMNSMVSTDILGPFYSLLNMKVIWLYIISAPPHVTMEGWGGGGGGGDLIWKFAKILWWQNYFLHLWQDKSLWVELKTYLLLCYYTFIIYFISLENKSEVFLLRISLGNVNASVVTCRYLQIYNFSFKIEFLETL